MKPMVAPQSALKKQVQVQPEKNVQQEIMSGMAKKLQQLEAVNKSLKNELGQRTKMVGQLEKENVELKVVTSMEWEKVVKEAEVERRRLNK